SGYEIKADLRRALLSEDRGSIAHEEPVVGIRLKRATSSRRARCQAANQPAYGQSGGRWTRNAGIGSVYTWPSTSKKIHWASSHRRRRSSSGKAGMLSSANRRTAANAHRSKVRKR